MANQVLIAETFGKNFENENFIEKISGS